MESLTTMTATHCNTLLVHTLRSHDIVELALLHYGLATISRLLKIIGLFHKTSSLLQGSFAKETSNVKEPTTCSHPIPPTQKLKHSGFEFAP